MTCNNYEIILIEVGNKKFVDIVKDDFVYQDNEPGAKSQLLWHQTQFKKDAKKISPEYIQFYFELDEAIQDEVKIKAKKLATCSSDNVHKQHQKMIKKHNSMIPMGCNTHCEGKLIYPSKIHKKLTKIMNARKAFYSDEDYKEDLLMQSSPNTKEQNLFDEHKFPKKYLGHIYCIELPNGKKYIGQANATTLSGKKYGYDGRYKYHMSAYNVFCNSENKSTKGCCRGLFEEMKKCNGKHTLSLVLICFMDDLDYYETYYIKKYNTLSPNGCNLMMGGKYSTTQHDDSRKLMSEKTKGENHPFFGKKLPKTAIEKKRVAMTGKPLTYDRKRKHDDGKGKLPKYVQYDPGLGYTVAGHPMGYKKSFQSKNQTMDEKRKDALTYVDYLNKGEIPPNALKGMRAFVAHKNKDPGGRELIKYMKMRFRSKVHVGYEAYPKGEKSHSFTDKDESMDTKYKKARAYVEECLEKARKTELEKNPNGKKIMEKYNDKLSQNLPCYVQIYRPKDKITGYQVIKPGFKKQVCCSAKLSLKQNLNRATKYLKETEEGKHAIFSAEDSSSEESEESD